MTQSTQIDIQKHRRKIEEVFDSAVDDYELVNDIMSLFQHRIWRRKALAAARIYRHSQVLDLAAGTCDFGLLAANRITTGRWVAADANFSMLTKGRARMEDKGIYSEYIQCIAESLPFPQDAFDRVLIGFGLRNFSDIRGSLRELLKVVRPGGRLVILEATRPPNTVTEKIWQRVAHAWLEAAGRLGSGDSKPYEYLADSISALPKAHELKRIMMAEGWENTTYESLSFGVATLFVCERE